MSICRVKSRILFMALFYLLFSVGALSLPSKGSNYSAEIQLDLRRVPFSCLGSYLAFSHLPGGEGHESGLYLRSVHGGVKQEVLRVDLVRNSSPIAFTEIATPTRLRLENGKDFAEIVFAEPNLLRFRFHGVGLRFTKLPNSFSYLFTKNTKQIVFNSPEQDSKFIFTGVDSKLGSKQNWNGSSANALSIEFVPDDERQAEGLIEEFRGSWKPRRYKGSFSVSLEKVEAEYRMWLDTMPGVPKELQAAADLAAYIDWSAVVEADGNLTRQAMLMSKNWMNAVWSWDHCFNAMVLATGRPQMSWNQFMLVMDKQNKEGALPDRLSDREMTWAFSKPPIHGWTLQWMMANSDVINQTRLAEAYQPLSRWTNWYFQYRDDDHDGLPQYNHGNDSGWDNSTVFVQEPPIETPDLAGLLVIQMDTLSKMAKRLNRAAEARQWKVRSENLLQLLLKTYWRDGHFIALHSGDHAVIQSDSLILYVPLLLGNQLPLEVRRKLVSDLREKGGFLTEHGLATEKIKSPWYESDGYWRGPIWAPSTMMIVDGLDAIGEKELATQLRRSYCAMVAEHGMAENYDAISGLNLRDPDYTWSASVFLIFAHQLSQP